MEFEKGNWESLYQACQKEGYFPYLHSFEEDIFRRMHYFIHFLKRRPEYTNTINIEEFARGPGKFSIRTGQRNIFLGKNYFLGKDYVIAACMTKNNDPTDFWNIVQKHHDLLVGIKEGQVKINNPGNSI